LTPADYALTIRAGIFGKGYPITEIKYDSQDRPEYIGIAPQNTFTSQAGWIVEKLTYSGNNMIRSRISPPNSIMDSYLTLDYN
jgi:hypothetical protein